MQRGLRRDGLTEPEALAKSSASLTEPEALAKSSASLTEPEALAKSRVSLFANASGSVRGSATKSPIYSQRYPAPKTEPRTTCNVGFTLIE